MKIGVTGHKGRLGSTLVERFGYFPIEFNFESYGFPKYLESLDLDAIVHCCAYTDVDRCEIDKIRAFNSNCLSVKRVREAFDGKIVYISTDYVFNGKKGNYKEIDSPDPICYYGLTKWGGEEILKLFKKPYSIVRIDSLYGSKTKRDFAQGILRELQQGEPFTVNNVLRGNPCHVFHLADAIKFILENKVPHIIHYAEDKILSRYQFALMIAEVFGYDSKLISPITEYPHIANRPINAGVNTYLAKNLGIPMYTVEQGLLAMKEDMKTWK